MQKSQSNCNSLSIVIPTYNPSRNFPVTIDYLRKKIAKYNVEVIIVNDGSSDTKYFDAIKSDHKIKKFTISNSGPLRARLHGVTKSTKNYIFFMDDDDIPDEHFFENFFNKDCNCDILLINLIFNEESKKAKFNCKEIEDNYFKNLCLRGEFGFSSSKIIRREKILDFISDNTITWPAFKFNYMEDLFLSLYLYKSNFVIDSNFKCLHFYNSNDNQISKKLNFNSIQSLLFVLKIREKFIKANFNQYLMDFYSNCFSQIIDELPLLLKNRNISFLEKRRSLLYIKNDDFFKIISRFRFKQIKSFKKWLIYIIFRIMVL